jgi:hypothetical protein
MVQYNTNQLVLIAHRFYIFIVQLNGTIQYQLIGIDCIDIYIVTVYTE